MNKIISISIAVFFAGCARGVSSTTTPNPPAQPSVVQQLANPAPVASVAPEQAEKNAKERAATDEAERRRDEEDTCTQNPECHAGQLNQAICDLDSQLRNLRKELAAAKSNPGGALSSDDLHSRGEEIQMDEQQRTQVLAQLKSLHHSYNPKACKKNPSQ